MLLKFILPVTIVILISGLFFYPITQQEDITINKPLIDVYNQLHNAKGWEKWDSTLKRETAFKQIGGKGGFVISTPLKK